MNAIADKLEVAPSGAQSLATPPPSRRRWTRLLRPILGTVAVIAAAVVGSWWFTEGRWIQSTDNAYVQGDIAVLGSRIAGDAAAIDVVDNQPVRAGDPLIRPDPADWQAQLAQARASAAEAAAAVLTAQRQIVQQQATIPAAQAAIAEARRSRR
ncbi:MAG TPA: biotin/lipoyl-binding protein [Acetobacteraceae bacterium]|nr:biotin/lipoyl-binding protein [Acetobacteraceae bacterium]